MIKKLKVCLISPQSLPLFDVSYDHEHVIGGAEINLYNLAICLSELDNLEIKVLVDNFGQPGNYKKGNIELIRYCGSSSKKDLPSRITAKISSYAQLLSIEADVFIFTTGNPLLGKLVLFQQILRRKKVIFRLSSDMNVDLEHFRKNNSYISYLLFKFGIRNASCIVSQTEKQKKLLEYKLGIKSEMIENGFQVKSDVDLTGKKHILWVGRCMESKRPMLFIELARRLPEEEFVMIIPLNKEIPADEYKKRTELANTVYKSAEQLNNIRVIDYVAYQDIQGYFDRAKSYVCTSETEGFPNTFIQAALAGTPIISYQINPDGMIGKYHLGMVCGDDPEKAVKFLREIDNDKLLEYKYHMFHYVLQKHNIYNAAKKYMNIIDRDFKLDFDSASVNEILSKGINYSAQ